MAGVSTGTGVMNSLLVKLAALLSDEYKLLERVRKEIQFLERELSGMQVLLERLADMEEKLDGLAKGWRDKVRDLSYDIEDCIDRFMDRLGSGDAKPKFMKRGRHAGSRLCGRAMTSRLKSKSSKLASWRKASGVTGTSLMRVTTVQRGPWR